MKTLMTILLIVTLLTQNNNAQNWLKVDSIFSPSGVTLRAFSAPAFGDLDNDGDYDLILGNIGDKADYFKNITTQLPSIFSKDTSILHSIYAGGLQFTNADYPSLIDFDNDGDLDLVLGGYNGLLYYQNIGNAINAVWQKVDSIFADSVNPQIGTDARPAFADLDADGDLDLLVGIGESLFGGPTPGLTFGFRNVGTAINPIFSRDDNLVIGIIDVGSNSFPTLADIDNDNDYDLLLGRDLSSFVYYKNTGTPILPVWTREFTTFAGVETTNYWKDPTFCDLDLDGDLDLIYGTDDGDLFFYQNNGTLTNPLFQHNSTYFNVIKVNGSSTVSFADFDNDGDYDLLSGSTLDKMQYLRNEGTPNKPIFVKTTAPFSSLNPGFRCSPVFVDIDKDNDFDIVSGADNGMIYCYINNGSTFSVNTTYFGSIDVGNASVPAFVDIDGDGDEDVLIGAETGNSYMYLQREGNSFVTPAINPFLSITFPNFSRPSFSDLDNDSDFDLIIGKSFGEVNYYENIGNAQNAQWQRNDALVLGLKVKQSSAPGFADLDNDGRIDCVIGEYDGNFTFFKNLFSVIPVELISFVATVTNSKVILNWETATESNNKGFEIERIFISRQLDTANQHWEIIGFINGYGSTTHAQNYSFTDNLINVIKPLKIIYRLRQLDFDGTFKYSDEIEVIPNLVKGFSLEQNYPNPFNPNTKISWQSPVGSWQVLKVFDVLGNEVATLVNEYRSAGTYEAIFESSFADQQLASGVYYYQLKTENFIQTKKMILIR